LQRFNVPAPWWFDAGRRWNLTTDNSIVEPSVRGSIDIDRATANYASGIPIYKVAQIENANRKAVSRALKNAGVQIIPSRGKRKHRTMSLDAKTTYLEAEQFLSGKRRALSIGEIAMLLNAIDELLSN
jgi:hypothetical protein